MGPPSSLNALMMGLEVELNSSCLAFVSRERVVITVILIKL